MVEPTPLERIARARAELATAIDEIDDKFNVPKRVRAFSERVKASYRSNPIPWIAGGVGAAAVIAGAIALVVYRQR